MKMTSLHMELVLILILAHTKPNWTELLSSSCRTLAGFQQESFGAKLKKNLLTFYHLQVAMRPGKPGFLTFYLAEN